MKQALGLGRAVRSTNASIGREFPEHGQRPPFLRLDLASRSLDSLTQAKPLDACSRQASPWTSSRRTALNIHTLQGRGNDQQRSRIEADRTPRSPLQPSRAGIFFPGKPAGRKTLRQFESAFTIIKVLLWIMRMSYHPISHLLMACWSVTGTALQAHQRAEAGNARRRLASQTGAPSSSSPPRRTALMARFSDSLTFRAPAGRRADRAL